jgi:hypothetical protein
MGDRFRHPWLLAVCRLFLYAGAAAGVAVLVGVALGVFGVLFVVTTLLLLLVGDVNLLGVVVTGGLGLGVLATLAWLLVTVARRVDSALHEAARIPTPLERLHESYVGGAIDEGELERGLERLLWAETRPAEAVDAGRGNRRTRRWVPPVGPEAIEVESPERSRATHRSLTSRR